MYREIDKHQNYVHKLILLKLKVTLVDFALNYFTDTD